MSRIGVILNNIGSPESAEPEAVGTYLKEFLMDKEILTIPFLFRYMLVHWVIVPRRKFSSALKYKKIWGKTQSPLIEISEGFEAKVKTELGSQYEVQLGMVNGQPSLKTALSNLKLAGVQKIIFAPMYPQYAKATTYASTQKIKGLMKNYFDQAVPLSVLAPFYENSDFISLSAKKLRSDWDSKKWQHILFSFHGLPESQIKKVQGCLTTADCCERVEACALNCYRAQSVQTARLIAAAANLTKVQYTICFQSRLGPAKWIGPASVDVVKELGLKGVKRLLVQTPSFVADCLETLEEISIELEDEFKKHGGENLKLVPCLNQDADWAASFGLVRKHLKSENKQSEIL